MATGGEPGSEAPHSISRESEEYRLQLEYAIWRKERRVHKLETVGILEEQLNRLTVREAGLLKPIPPPPPSPSRSPPARRRLYVDTDLTEEADRVAVEVKKEITRTMQIRVWMMGLQTVPKTDVLVDVPVDAGYDETCAAAVSKQLANNQALPRGGYVLLYKDATKADHLPGTETPFTIRGYDDSRGTSKAKLEMFICPEGQYFIR